MSDRHSNRKLSRGILKSRVQDDRRRNDGREHQRIKIYIQNPEHDDDASSVTSDNEFERLKELYYKECRPINQNFVKKFERRNDTQDYDPNEMKCTRLTMENHGASRSNDYERSRPQREHTIREARHHCMGADSTRKTRCPNCDKHY